MKPKNITLSIVLILLFVLNSGNYSYSEDFKQVEHLFSLRNTITDQGSIIPEKIRNAQGADIRTLERIFEMETSMLTTMEAYFRILMISISSKSESTPETVKILNGWLEFIINQCKYDIEYLDEALKETKSPAVIEEIISAKDNIEKLSDIAKKSIAENSAMLVKN
ncbi:MAG: hypothetical protein ABH862_05845 [Candidatus Omnitrophota bacterium]